MFVAVYFNSKTGMGRDELGDLLLDALMDDGKDLAKVTGGGSGLGGSNIDLKVDDRLGADEVVRRIREVCRIRFDSRPGHRNRRRGRGLPLYPTSG